MQVKNLLQHRKLEMKSLKGLVTGHCLLRYHLTKRSGTYTNFGNFVTRLVMAWVLGNCKTVAWLEFRSTYIKGGSST